jgi:hypothetical protein
MAIIPCPVKAAICGKPMLKTMGRSLTGKAEIPADQIDPE